MVQLDGLSSALPRSPDLVDGASPEGGESVDGEALVSPDSAAPQDPEARQEWQWRRAGRVLLMALCPGTAHLAIGYPVRAFAWTLLFLSVVVPVGILFYLIGSYTPTVWSWIGGLSLLFYLLSARGPTLDTLVPHRRMAIHPARRGRYASRTLLLSYAAFVTFSVLFELVAFRLHYFESQRVEGERMAAILKGDGRVTVLVSRHVRPVHGEVVFFSEPRAFDPDLAPAERPRRLGRVLAKPADTVAASDGRLIVNSIEVNPDSAYPRRRLEKKGRRARRVRFLTNLGNLLSSPEAPPNTVEWNGQNWGPLVMPKGVYLLLPDVRGDDVSRALSDTAAWTVTKGDILGRVVH